MNPLSYEKSRLLIGSRLQVQKRHVGFCRTKSGKLYAQLQQQLQKRNVFCSSLQFFKKADFFRGNIFFLWQNDVCSKKNLL